jgi:hypothetical protein
MLLLLLLLLRWLLLLLLLLLLLRWLLLPVPCSSTCTSPHTAMCGRTQSCGRACTTAC